MEGDATQTDGYRSDPVTLVGSLPLFRGLDRETLAAIAAELEWQSIPGGATLFEAGDPPDAMYVLVSGALAVYSAGDEGRFLSRIPVGEPVGEMGLLSGRPRSATIRALRDSDLARLPRESFDRVILRHPAAMLRIAQLVVERLESVERRAKVVGSRTYTVLPQSAGVDADGFATALVAAMSVFGSVEVVRKGSAADHTSAWFHAIESSNDFVVYVADPEPTPWTKLCLRQADSVVLLTRGELPTAPWPAMPEGGRFGTARAELVLLHHDHVLPGAAARWLRLVPGVAHHHVRGPKDMARVARILAGRAVGVVLSGGGARGFAHIGVVRALQEVGLPIDLVGGTSIGAVMGAGVASDWSAEEMKFHFHRSLVATNPLGDYTVPIVSLVAGRKIGRLLRQEFGDVAIEDLPLSFYCVSSNLTTDLVGVHRQGDLCKWVRASVAIPGVLPPIFHEGQVHVDGGTMNNLPVDVMRAANRGPIIGVDVASGQTLSCDTQDLDLPRPWRLVGARNRRQRPSILQILWRSGTVNSDAAAAAAREMTDLLLRPPLASVDTLNWHAFDRAIEAGYRHAKERIASLDAESRARLGVPGR